MRKCVRVYVCWRQSGSGIVDCKKTKERKKERALFDGKFADDVLGRRWLR